MPTFNLGLSGGTITFNVTGTDASSLGIAKVANDWIVTPTSTSTDDVTYTFKVNATDGCNHFVGVNS